MLSPKPSPAIHRTNLSISAHELFYNAIYPTVTYIKNSLYACFSSPIQKKMQQQAHVKFEYIYACGLVELRIKWLKP
jgi:hypothetical protein